MLLVAGASQGAARPHAGSRALAGRRRRSLVAGDVRGAPQSHRRAGAGGEADAARHARAVPARARLPGRRLLARREGDASDTSPHSIRATRTPGRASTESGSATGSPRSRPRRWRKRHYLDEGGATGSSPRRGVDHARRASARARATRTSRQPRPRRRSPPLPTAPRAGARGRRDRVPGRAAGAGRGLRTLALARLRPRVAARFVTSRRSSPSRTVR